MCRARLGKGKPWHPMTLEEVHKRFPLFLSERALPAEDADALLRELLVEGQTWTQDEWWIAGEARKAPRLTAVYEMTPGGGEAGVADGEENESLFENALRAPSDDARRGEGGGRSRDDGCEAFFAAFFSRARERCA